MEIKKSYLRNCLKFFLKEGEKNSYLLIPGLIELIFNQEKGLIFSHV